MIERARRPEPTLGMPGGISRGTLEALNANSSRFGWHSLEDDTMLRTFIPKIEIIKTELNLDISAFDSVIDGTSRLPEVFSGFSPKADFDRDKALEIQRAILLYEVNKIKIEKGIEFPWVPLQHYRTGIDDSYVQVGNHVPPLLAPIPEKRVHKVVAQVIFKQLEGIDLNVLMRNLTHIAANVRVLNTMFGTNYALPFQA